MKKRKTKKLPASTRAKISKAMTGRRLTAEHRARIGEGVAGAVLTPAERAERRKAAKAAWAASPKGRAWLAKNQKKKNKARQAWRAKKKAEQDASKMDAAGGPSNVKDEPRPRLARAVRQHGS